MSHESVRLAPRIFQALHDNEHDAPLRIRPLRPLDFPSLMHMSIGIPRRAMFSESTMSGIYNAMTPLLSLHLSSLTIGIEDVSDPFDVFELLHTLNASERQWYMKAMVKGPGTTVMEEERPVADCYRVLTTYNNIARLATPINCLVAPGLCNGKHDHSNPWCLQISSLYPPAVVQCNVRRIELRLKKLHVEQRCSCGKLPHLSYSLGSVHLRWSPAVEVSLLAKEGWWCGWKDRKGTLRHWSKDMPAAFVWRKVEEKVDGRFKRKMKGLLKWL